MFTRAWTPIQAVIAADARATNGSRLRAAIRNPATISAANRASTARRAEQAELLADDRVDEVGVRLGQVAPLLAAAPRARLRESPPEASAKMLCAPCHPLSW